MANVDLWDPNSLKQSERKKRAQETRTKFQWLESEIGNLYDEFDKLTKKAPSHYITTLALENVNAAISDAKELLSGDKAVDRISEFVAAGENPVNSDVLLVLSKLRAALVRFKKLWTKAWNELSMSPYR